MKRPISRAFCTVFAILVLTLYLGIVSGRTIDEIIASSSTAVTNFDFMGDVEGTVIRIELDMMLSLEQYSALYNPQNAFKSDKLKSNSRMKRKAMKSLATRWTSKEIPYSFERSTFSDKEKNEIYRAMNEWENNTCITFRSAISSDSSFIHFEDGSGCSSYIGMGAGKRPITLAKGCREKGVIAHEIGHAVGFYHEQNRPDRDDYIIIKKENIVHPDLYSNFQKYPDTSISTYGVPYDYRSIMHYGGLAFSGNDQYTIVTIDPSFQNEIGNREGLSFRDIKLANLMYKCSENCKSVAPCPSEGFMGKDCKCWCPGNPIKRCDGTRITERPSVKTTARPTNKPTVRPTLRPTVKPTTCTDTNPLCSGWAKTGFCQTSNYVRTYCKASCSVCTGTPITTNTCKNTRDHCRYWGDRGFCEGIYRSYMRKYCPETCGNCSKTWNNNGQESITSTEKISNKNGQNGITITEQISIENAVNAVSSSYFLIVCTVMYCLLRS